MKPKACSPFRAWTVWCPAKSAPKPPTSSPLRFWTSLKLRAPRNPPSQRWSWPAGSNNASGSRSTLAALNAPWFATKKKRGAPTRPPKIHDRHSRTRLGTTLRGFARPHPQVPGRGPIPSLGNGSVGSAGHVGMDARLAAAAAGSRRSCAAHLPHSPVLECHSGGYCSLNQHDPALPRYFFMSAEQKITPEHLKRTAYLYVRQSTLRQVLHHAESARRQYALRQRAAALGWREDQIIVVDGDTAHTAASAAGREGFQRLVIEVGLGHAGLVMGLEVSRLARNCSDWHRLLELCALTDTLILDEEALYDANQFNDRLLLGLKGAMSEAELHLIKARLQGAILSKARRGEIG